MNHKNPITWTIAASDSSAGAGIQADLHTFKALGVYGCSVTTTSTAQNTLGVKDLLAFPADHIAAQINTLEQDLPAKAVKLGVLGNAKSMLAILPFLITYTGQVVLDPVMVAGSGDNLLFNDPSEYLRILALFYPTIDIITPNIPEAEILTNTKIQSYDDMKNAAEILLSQGLKSVLIKGGHFNDDILRQDYWTNGKENFWLSSPRIDQENVHGTGCTLSSAITAFLAKGLPIKEALVLAKMYVTQSIAEAQKFGQGALVMQHHPLKHKQQFLPYLSKSPLQSIPVPFQPCGYDLGLYPVVDSSEWLEKLLPLGIKIIQLRIKDKTGQALENEIEKAVKLSEQYSARLFVNDYWQLAIKHRAYGVHLGQEDLLTANINEIKIAGLRLGLSTHSYEELATAHSFTPSYMAFGPIFATTSKEMPFDPQGLARLKLFRSLIDYPLVAIGGINETNIANVAKTGVDAIAMISAITQAKDPLKATQELMNV